jgi:hypothetical protein
MQVYKEHKHFALSVPVLAWVSVTTKPTNYRTSNKQQLTGNYDITLLTLTASLSASTGTTFPSTLLLEFLIQLMATNSGNIYHEPNFEYTYFPTSTSFVTSLILKCICCCKLMSLYGNLHDSWIFSLFRQIFTN